MDELLQDNEYAQAIQLNTKQNLKYFSGHPSGVNEKYFAGHVYYMFGRFIFSFHKDKTQSIGAVAVGEEDAPGGAVAAAAATT